MGPISLPCNALIPSTSKKLPVTSSAPICSSCHGTHEILKANDRQSKTHPLNIIKICGDCHSQFKTPTPDGHDAKTWVVNYLESVHGRAVSKGGLAVAATCADCHGPHKVLPAKDLKSSVNRAQVPQTCGKCHTGINETFQTSIHGQKLAAGDKKAPVCVDCHTAHGITRTDTPAFKLDIVAECGTCHDRPDIGKKHYTPLSETYRRSYHGQVTSLGFIPKLEPVSWKMLELAAPISLSWIAAMVIATRARRLACSASAAPRIFSSTAFCAALAAWCLTV